jgi:hypothetical protein
MRLRTQGRPLAPDAPLLGVTAERAGHRRCLKHIRLGYAGAPSLRRPPTPLSTDRSTTDAAPGPSSTAHGRQGSGPGQDRGPVVGSIATPADTGVERSTQMVAPVLGGETCAVSEKHLFSSCAGAVSFRSGFATCQARSPAYSPRNGPRSEWAALPTPRLLVDPPAEPPTTPLNGGRLPLPVGRGSGPGQRAGNETRAKSRPPASCSSSLPQLRYAQPCQVTRKGGFAAPACFLPSTLRG